MSFGRGPLPRDAESLPDAPTALAFRPSIGKMGRMRSLCGLGRGDIACGHEDISRDWVQRQLRAISAVEPPESLKGRLIAGIPATGREQPATRRVYRCSRWLRSAGVATVVVEASVIARLGVSSIRQSHPIATSHDPLGLRGRPQHFASDANLCDITACNDLSLPDCGVAASA